MDKAELQAELDGMEVDGDVTDVEAGAGDKKKTPRLQVLFSCLTKLREVRGFEIKHYYTIIMLKIFVFLVVGVYCLGSCLLRS